ncbi:phenolic acid decarboxylase [Halocatena halophila]|uniref:phenolic acid decarboxylase n=1 Tax=Halocatena halophila TaxID=2814576 RepID=UPI002ED61506
MGENSEKTSTEEVSRILGKHLIYTYDNGWEYELYVKNSTTIDYRIHSGMVGGRWVRNQDVSITKLTDNIFKIYWDEPTGTSVSVTYDLTERQTHGVVFFPQWIKQNPELTICYQNNHLDEMRQYRDQGPTYPKLIMDEPAEITFMEDVGTEREDIINCAPQELPDEYADRRN